MDRDRTPLEPSNSEKNQKGIDMKIKGKQVKISEGISFKEAEVIYSHFMSRIRGRKKYTPANPFFIRKARTSSFYTVYESNTMVCIRPKNWRDDHKIKWCDFSIVDFKTGKALSTFIK